MDMGSMDHSGGSGCKVSMLWNWDTIDTCFLASSWHITNQGMFAATCIGAALLVIVLEFLRRLGKELDVQIANGWRRRLAALEPTLHNQSGTVNLTFRASPIQQLARAFVHAVTFALAYLLMLLAMYYNGYVLISMFLGAGIGKFVCDWMQETVVVQIASSSALQDLDTPPLDGKIITKPMIATSVTGCCCD